MNIDGQKCMQNRKIGAALKQQCLRWWKFASYCVAIGMFFGTFIGANSQWWLGVIAGVVMASLIATSSFIQRDIEAWREAELDAPSTKGMASATKWGHAPENLLVHPDFPQMSRPQLESRLRTEEAANYWLSFGITQWAAKAIEAEEDAKQAWEDR